MRPARSRWLARRHRGLYWASVLVALAVTIGGSTLAYVGWRSSSGPGAVVEDYFAALARADAPAALGLGDIPHGPRTLLTSAVLRAQQRVAPISGVNVLAVDVSGDRARVSVSYRLAFARGEVRVADDLAVRKDADGWRLAASAVPVRLRMPTAEQRASLLGGAVPKRAVLMFPGALPLHFDSDYLRLTPSSRYLRFSTRTTVDLGVELTRAGRRAVRTALDTALRRCFDDDSDAGAGCPLPEGRYVPGSLRGRVSGLNAERVHVRVSGPAAKLTIAATLTFTGDYRRLSFDNVARAGSGSLPLPVQAVAYAHAPLQVRWAAS